MPSASILGFTRKGLTPQDGEGCSKPINFAESHRIESKNSCVLKGLPDSTPDNLIGETSPTNSQDDGEQFREQQAFTESQNDGEQVCERQPFSTDSHDDGEQSYGCTVRKFLGCDKPCNMQFSVDISDCKCDESFACTESDAKYDENLVSIENLDKHETNLDEKWHKRDREWCFKASPPMLGIYKGPRYNGFVQQETRDSTYEPLDVIPANNLVTCAVYTEGQDLLDTSRSKQSHHFATRVERFQELPSQESLKSVRHSPTFETGSQLLYDPNKAVAIDKSNDNSIQQNDGSFERAKFHEYNTSTEKGKAAVQVIHMVYNIKHDGRRIYHDMITWHSVTGVLCLINKRHNSLSYLQVCEAIPNGVTYSQRILSAQNLDDAISKCWSFVGMWLIVNLLLFWQGNKSNCEVKTSNVSRQADGECHGSLPCNVSLRCTPLSMENASVSQSDGCGVYVSRVEFVSALLRQFPPFALHTEVIRILE
jgi:hypothetical protein